MKVAILNYEDAVSSSIVGTYDILTKSNMIEWIKLQYKEGSEVASLCMGTFLLAATGLLNGKKAATHWMGISLFKKLFPEVCLEDDKVIIDEGRIYSSGAAFSFTTLMVYLIEKFCGCDLALAVAKVLMIQVHNSGKNSFAIFGLQRNHEDVDIKPAQDFIEKHYGDEQYVNKIAEKFNMSNRNFIRRFTLATGNSPLKYIQRVRVEAAKRLLEKGKVGIEQICLKSGYEDFNFFRKVFKRHTGLSPMEYRRKYGNMFNDAILS